MARAALVAAGPSAVEEAYRAYVDAKPKARAAAAKGIWRNRLAAFHGKLVAELTEGAARTWVEEQRAEGMTEATIRNAWDHLAAAVRRLRVDKRIAELPWGAFRPPSKPKRHKEGAARVDCCRNVEEFLACLAAARRRELRCGYETGLMYKVGAMGVLGLRQAEAGALGWEDTQEFSEVDASGTQRPVLVVSISYQVSRRWREEHPEWRRPMAKCKWDSAGTITLRGLGAALLIAHREALRERGLYHPKGPVFPDQKRAPGIYWREGPVLVPPEVSREIARDAGMPNWEKYNTHSWRHSFGTMNAAVLNGDLLRVAELMRHADPDMSLTYIHTARGGPSSRLEAAPAFTEGLLRPPTLALPGRAPALSRALEASGRTIDAAVEREREEKKVLSKKRRRGVLKTRGRFVEVLAEWGGEGVPSPIIKMADDAYSKAYKRARREGGGKERCQAAGQRGRSGLLSAWKRFAAGKARLRGRIPGTGPRGR